MTNITATIVSKILYKIIKANVILNKRENKYYDCFIVFVLLKKIVDLKIRTETLQGMFFKDIVFIFIIIEFTYTTVSKTGTGLMFAIFLKLFKVY